ncbi:MAG TPA: NRAMP family divalent metal transporter [Candidatus Baltobacteraceae bacterium]
MKKRGDPRTPPWRLLGPGIISGASDNDPTTVATLAVIGSTTVYALGWLVLLVIPMLAAVQAISGRVGAVCGEGLETILKQRYGRVAALVVLAAVFVVDQITLAADLEGGGAALQVLSGWDYRWFMIPLAVLTACMLTFANYNAVRRYLIYIPLVFFAYAAAAFMAHPNWHGVLYHTFVPHIHIDRTFSSGAIALMGTTLTAYAYVWETIEMSEERPKLMHLGLVQADAALGTVIAGIIFWFIVIATGATLGLQHHTVQTAQDAANALAPLAGRWASLLFGIGLLGSSLIALPVLAGTSAYVAAEMFGWRKGIDAKFQQAPFFYTVVFGTLAIAVGITFAGIAPIPLLFSASIAGGLATPITLFFVLLAAGSTQLMGSFRLPLWLRIAGWLVFGIVTSATILYLRQVL